MNIAAEKTKISTKIELQIEVIEGIKEDLIRETQHLKYLEDRKRLLLRELVPVRS